MSLMQRVDVHQHLWPAQLVDALRARSKPPYLRDWTLTTAGEPPYEVDPQDHDPKRRADLDPDTRIIMSLSTPLGIEALDPHEGRPLLDAWHTGVGESPFDAWVAVSEIDPDLDGLRALLDDGFVGLQVSATALRSPRALEHLAPVLRVCERADAAVLVHPGPCAPTDGAPEWWAAVVDYPAQLQAAWWSWHAVGRTLLPTLRICFAAGAGLAPAHRERLEARGGGRLDADHGVFVDTSSYGRLGLDALRGSVGLDAIVLGSDRPYAEPIDALLDDADRAAIAVTNPARLLTG